jgi:hypothetical protein
MLHELQARAEALQVRSCAATAAEHAQVPRYCSGATQKLQSANK